ncbi:MAG: thioredoxin fold domain-containing protein [Campylobacterota bacterium]|nr:thioredoxin fold domain-containing protein [Campylobacterota bacterium]
MYKLLRTTLIIGSMSLLMVGCNEKSSKATVIESEAPVAAVQQEAEMPKAQEVVKPAKKVEKLPVINMAKEAAAVIHEVFQDTAKIGPNGKYMVLVFGTNTCPYCMKLKEDIFQSKEFQNRLKNDYSSYYFKTHENLRHKLYHEKEFMDVDTKTMISIYGVEGTPTIIFTDKEGKAVIMVPGYMPAKQFMATLDFMESENWVGKDRKDGEVYQALKDFYISKGIITK